MRIGRFALAFATLLAFVLASAPASAHQADDCGGPLSFGEIVACSSITDEQQHAFTVTTQEDADVLYAKLRHTSGDGIGGTVTAPDGERVCGLIPAYVDTCQLGTAGTYTITVALEYPVGTAGYSLAVESVRTPSSCTDLRESFFSFASPGVTGTLPAGAAATCYRFDQPTGSVLRPADTGGAGDVRGTILDAQFQPVCGVDFATTCKLTQPGPYRIFLYELYGDQSGYTLKMPRLSQSVGCPAVQPAAFGDPGANAETATVSTDDEACHKLTAPSAGMVAIRIAPDQDVVWTLYDDAGQPVCEKYPNFRDCQLPAAGNYTLLVTKQYGSDAPITYQVAIPALYASAGCAAATGTSWDLPALVVHQTSTVQTNCQPFDGEAGDRIIAYTAPTAHDGSLYGWIVDGTGAPVCPGWTGEDGCVLPSSGTYRVISYGARTGTQSEVMYKMQVRRLSSPDGCPTRAVGPYGATPVPSGIRCRILDVTGPGLYMLKTVDARNYPIYAQVYDSAGLRVCGSPQCEFATPGRYTMVLEGSQTTRVIDNDVQYATVFLPTVPSGCPQISDGVTQIATHRGQFNGAGQIQCLELTSPAGANVIELLPGDATGAGQPEVTVVDSTGAWICDSSYGLRQASCELNGTAPFFAVFSPTGGYPTGSYEMAFPRVDGAPGCPVLPRTATGATVDTSADRFAVCFSIPADEHGAREVFTYRRTAGTGDASLAVFDGSGIRYCRIPPSIDRTVTCSLPAGPVTVILEADGVDASYQLTHRAP